MKETSKRGILLYCDIHYINESNGYATGGFQHWIQLADFGTDRIRADSIRRVNADDENMSIRLRTFQQ